MRRIAYLLALLLPATASGEWRSIDGSTFDFEAGFEGEPLPGSFPVFDVRIDFDTADVENGRLVVSVALVDADMGDEEMNAVLADPAWFDSARYGVARFASEEIAANEHGYVAKGELDLKGTTKPISVPFAWTETGDSASMEGTFALRRTDFDVGSGEWSTGDAIGLDVTLSFVIRLERVD